MVVPTLQHALVNVHKLLKRRIRPCPALPPREGGARKGAKRGGEARDVEAEEEKRDREREGGRT